MSLLLEALKKAEKAKEEAQRRAREGEAPQAAPDPEATVLDQSRHVTRRNELPDISAPMEIVSDDLRPAAPAAPAPLALVDETPPPPPAPEPRPAARRERARAAADAQNAAASSERAAAQKVFEAKFREPNPRLPFYIAMGVLGVFALGTVGYFWVQLRPAPALVNTNPGRPADEKPVEVAAAKPAAAPAAPGASELPGLPGATVVTPPAASAPAQAAPAATTPQPPAAAPVAPPMAAPSTAKPVARAAPRKPAPSAEDTRTLSVSRGGPQIHPRVAAGYAAYQSGDLAAARAEYQQALREDSASRDALLGLAAVEMRAQRYELSDSYYQRLLQADPRDPHALAGMLALRSQQLDPVAAESRVKSLLAADRDANVLYFTLGNQYAQQGRWAEAQQAYFKAFAADPENPDFAFNLAVSFDQIRQPQLALDYYRRALALAEKRISSFAAEAARARVQQLSR
ncbi:MAG: tetratricopeptide repeat protein [Betaproteobacteria bacterium]|nr:tetratricopeptide repeat protein [Betaproteobacteria bacterium]